MIKRITNPDEFKEVADDIFRLHELDSEENGHTYLRHNKESIIANLAHIQTLAWHVFVWAHHNGTEWDAIIMFGCDRNPMFGSKNFTEHIWLSKNPKVGYKLLREALKFAKKEEFDYVLMGCVEKGRNASSVRRFYQKMGFVKDSETYIAKL